jgi:hypothetical protein
MKKELELLVAELKKLDLDGETAEDILEQLGLREQVLKQVLDSEKYITAHKVWNDFYNNETLIYGADDFGRYYTDKFLNDGE